MKIRELKEVFEKKGVRYTQVEKNDRYCIYKCECLEYEDTYYEVFKYKLANPHPMDAEDWDKIEIYPSDNRFGIDAWCCSDWNIVERVLKNHFSEKESK